MPDNILIEQPADGVGLIRIHRPERRNALNTATLAEIAAALDDFAADESIRVVILTGDDRAFAAGADVTEMQGKSPVEALANLRARYWDAVRFFPKPIIAAVNLHARVDDRPLDPAVATNLDVVHQDRTLDLAIAVHPYTGRQNTAEHAAARHDAAGRHDRIDRHPHPPALLRK